MVGVVAFILPISLLVGLSSIGNAQEAFLSNEMSGDPGGLPHRWVVKALIPLSFLLLIITSFGYFIKNLNVYRGMCDLKEYNLKGEIENLKNEFNQHKHHIVDIDEKGESK